MKVDGTCHCGAIAFEAEIDPDRVNLCHCTDCQMLTGSAFRATAQAPSATFRLLRGAPTIYVKTAESGTKRAHAFCPTCGTPVYASAVTDPPTYSLRLGTLRQRAALTPKKQQWVRSALPWVMNIDGLPKSERGF